MTHGSVRRAVYPPPSVLWANPVDGSVSGRGIGRGVDAYVVHDGPLVDSRW